MMIIFNFDKIFFETLIDSLNASRVNYCIIGDYLSLPEKINHDIDFWTDDVSLFHRILKKVVKQQNFRIFIDNQTINGFNFAFYKRDGKDFILMKIDVFKNTSYKSLITLVDTKTIRENRISVKNFFVVSLECEAIMHLLYPLLEWGGIKKEEYKTDIANRCGSKVFQNVVIKCFGKSNAEILRTLVENHDWEKLQSLTPQLRRSLIVRSLFRPYFGLAFAQLIFSHLKRMVYPSGHYIVFCGLDGAGKTTILDTMNQMFVNLLKSKKVFYGYWRPFCIPEIKKLLRRNKKDEPSGKVLDANERPPRGKIISLFKLFYYCIDYMLGPFRYAGIRNRGGIVMFDRHYIDIIIHPQRFEMGLSEKVLRFFYRFIPKPDSTFFLWASPQEIHHRKAEFTYEQIEDQIKHYNNVGNQIKNYIPIETNKTVPEEIDEILFHITQRINHD